MSRDGAGRVLLRHRGRTLYASEHGPTRRGKIGMHNAPPPVEPMLGDRRLVYRELLALPGEADALERLIRRYMRTVPGTRSVPVTDPGGFEMLLQTWHLLSGPLPSPPAVRAALYRVVARQGDVRALGPQLDTLGRTGQAVAADAANGTEVRLIFDPRTARLLAFEERRGGRLMTSDVIAGTGIVRSTRERPSG